jgi:hypothetical protein
VRCKRYEADHVMPCLEEPSCRAGRSQILLTGIRVDPGSAALANGAAIHALDFDDQYDPARVHSFAQLRAKFSACLGSVTDSHVEAFRLCLTEPEAGTGTAETVLAFRRLVTGNC